MRESNAAHWRAKQIARHAWPHRKSLALIPQAYAMGLAYGRNPISGAESPAGQWLVRNIIVWHRPNPTVGALGDKFRPSTSYIVVATRDTQRWFDLSAVRRQTERRASRDGHSVKSGPEGTMTATYDYGAPTTAGAPPLDCWSDEIDEHLTWTMSSQPSRLAHYAMWPPKLAERLILSMCPAEVCAACGEPRRRIEGAYTLDAFRGSNRPQTRRAVAIADAAGLSDA
ncbi:MAG TPA: DNA methyltransferase, partial [Ilumatobacteraceae bacterium]|nr:DNA methyltransferase [Ilumatobacteraceae bacterium]